MASDAPVADLAAARREAEEALRLRANERVFGSMDHLCIVIERLLAATANLPEIPESSPPPSDAVREAAERLALLRMVAAEGCRDKPGSGVTCREAGVPPDEVCEVCRVIKYLSAQGGGR